MNLAITITITRYFAVGAICLAIGAALASKAPEENANPNNPTCEPFGPEADPLTRSADAKACAESKREDLPHVLKRVPSQRFLGPLPSYE